MAISEALDPTFYNLIHQISPETADDSADRRSRERHTFPTVQRIAPYFGAVLPHRDDFHEVQCHNLSTSGFAYLAEEKPAFSRVIVSLSTALSTTHVAASIVHVRKVDGYGKHAYMIGCRFLERVQL